VGDVVGFPEKSETEMTQSGPARCLHCGHNWVGVAPAGTLIFDCPVCGLHKGVFLGLCLAPAGKQVWTCKCGCDLFQVVADEHGKFAWMHCLMCGSPQEFG
jgi:hypothetical protein